MHGVLLGVQKLLLRLWFDKDLASKCFNIHNKVGIVDSRLTEIKPTLDITRLSRSISTDLKYWKASEFHSFLLFYGPLVLYGILHDMHFEHYMLLSNYANFIYFKELALEDIQIVPISPQMFQHM